MLFFVISALLVFATGTVLALAWFRARSESVQSEQERERINRLVARERLAELDRFGPENADREKIETELAAELAQDTAGARKSIDREDDVRTGPWLGLAMAAMLFIGSGVVYLLLGSPGAINGVQLVGQTAPEGAAPGSMTLDEIVAKLSERLRENPDDAEGWSMLARSYAAMERYADAVPALRNLRRLAGNTPDSMAQLADALAMSQGGRIDGEASQLIDEALEADPNLPRALWLAATRARQQSRPRDAVALFERLAPLVANDPQVSQQVEAILAETRAEAGLAANTVPAAPEAPATGFSIQVSVDPAMTVGLNGDETVYVYARAASGPPMPLAAKRLPVSSLPATIRLAVSDAMLPNMSLENFAEVVVGARVSMTGQPVPSSGDRQGESDVVSWRDVEGLSVTIDRKLP